LLQAGAKASPEDKVFDSHPLFLAVLQEGGVIPEASGVLAGFLSNFSLPCIPYSSGKTQNRAACACARGAVVCYLTFFFSRSPFFKGILRGGDPRLAGGGSPKETL